MTEPARSPRSPRVWVVAASALVVTAVACAASPAVQREVALSTTRQSAPFVELYFADEAAARACPASGVEIAVRSHLDEAARLAWRASVTRADGAASPRRLRGVLETRPGRVARAELRYAPPTAAYTLRVALDGRREHLVLHCPASPGAVG